MYAPTLPPLFPRVHTRIMAGMVNDNTPEPSDIDRLLRNLLRYGVVAQVQASPPRVRVAIGELTTDWLRWFNLRAGNVKGAWQPSPGEQALVLSPGGHLEAGSVLLGLNSDAQPAPEAGPDDLVIDVPEGGKLLLRCGASTLEITADNLKLKSARIDLN